MRKPYVGADVLYRMRDPEEHPWPVRPSKVLGLNDDGSCELLVLCPGQYLQWVYKRAYKVRHDAERPDCWLWPEENQ